MWPPHPYPLLFFSFKLSARVWMASSLVRSIPTSCLHFQSHRLPLRASATPSQKARFVARRKESISVQQLERPLSNVRDTHSYHNFSCNLNLGFDWLIISVSVIAVEYMRLPASQYSVLDAERIERVSEDTFRCYVYTIKFFSFEVCPVLLVKVEEQPNGCCIKLLSCKVCSLAVLLNLIYFFFPYFPCSSDFFCLILVIAWGLAHGGRAEREVWW